MLHIHIIFCRHILFCNVLTTILRPNFEEPLDTVKQLVESNIKIYTTPGSSFWKYFFQDSTIPEYKILGDTLIIADDWDQYKNISKHVIGAGTHALMTLSLPPMYLDMGRWHRSKEKVSGINPYAGYLTNKKWHLNEVISFKLFVCVLLIILILKGNGKPFTALSASMKYLSSRPSNNFTLFFCKPRQV